MRHYERSGYLKPALIEFSAKRRHVGGQITVRPQFGPFVAGLRHLVEETMPGGLFRIAGEPDAPVVRCAADFDIHGSTPYQSLINLNICMCGAHPAPSNSIRPARSRSGSPF